MTEKIKIIKIGRKQQPSKYKPGETYSITTLMDEKNRKLSAIGKWSDNWQVGDVIEAEVEERKWTDRDGFEQTNLALKNPNQSTFKGFTPKNIMIDAYHIAAELAPVIYSSSKKITMKEIDELAEYVKGKLESSSQTAPVAEKAVPSIDVNKSESVEDNGVEVEEATDEKPF